MESNEQQQMDMNSQFPIISILEHLNPLDNQSLISLGKRSKLKQGQQNQIQTQSIFDSLDLDIPSCYQRPAREDWTKQEQILFFKFLGQYMIQNPQCFLSWSKANKKGVFSKMQVKIKTRDKVQCRLKFSSYKRKHSDKSQKSWYINCMRTLIIRKLKQHMEEDEECQQILKKIQIQNTNKKHKNEAQTGVNIRKNRPAPDSDQYIGSTLQNHQKSRIKKQKNSSFQDIYFEDIQFNKTHDQLSEYVDNMFKDHEEQKSLFACHRKFLKKGVLDDNFGVNKDQVKYG